MIHLTSLKENLLPIAREVLKKYPELKIAIYIEGKVPTHLKYSSVFQVKKALDDGPHVVGSLSFHAVKAAKNNGRITVAGSVRRTTEMYEQFAELTFIELLEIWTVSKINVLKRGSSMSGSSESPLSQLEDKLSGVIQHPLAEEANVIVKVFSPEDPHTTVSVELSGQHTFEISVDLTDGCKLIIRNVTTNRVVELVVTNSTAKMGIIHVTSIGSIAPQLPSAFLVTESKFTR